MMQEDDTVRYRFQIEVKVKFGEAVFLAGSVDRLGGWDCLKAVRLTCSIEKHWMGEVELPLETQIEYKYFIAPFELKGEQLKSVAWLGQTNNQLYIYASMKHHFAKENDRCLNIMSFNVRMETARDTGERSWVQRRDKVVQTILEYLPDVIGVQQPKKSQRQFMSDRLCMFYDYYGKPRDLWKDEQSGIFIRKDKFVIRQARYIWINEQKKEGGVGYGANLPRYFTLLVLSPLAFPQHMIALANTHLDHQSQKSRQMGIKLIAEAFAEQFYRYKTSKMSYFLTGDFNTCETNPIFKHLKFNNVSLQSMRQLLPAAQSDNHETFNGYSVAVYVAERVAQFFKMNSLAVIDHIFTSSETYKPIKFEVIRVKDKIVSDHYPIIGRFTM